MKYIVLILTLLTAGITTMASAETVRDSVHVNSTKLELEYRKINNSGGDFWLINDIRIGGTKVHISKSEIKRARLSDAQINEIRLAYITMIEKTLEKAIDQDVVSLRDIGFHVKRNRDLHATVGSSRVSGTGVSTYTKEVIWNTLNSNGAGDDKSHRVLLDSIARAVYTTIKTK